MLTAHLAPEPASAELPAGWESLDIGTVGVAGAATVAGNTWTVSGSGANLGETSDQVQVTSIEH